ncbi:hypothetical protein BCR33DRAFT_190029 [Rhizoclosmatium globosum]|uniref:Uncharacterized protein n=1 Tax=Rhizoclosmatium globosum TaxID=329046 RepID=A0A1Y2D3P7_9FUNG|nr:hypothetical protein BCR33DRAFT_190029 [Rhizoclosmatium globosum]|eukprot:ORY53185.1 hypothetical protein BCR33DRAFT_190029 [Rhizoclosmatium globosum]
MDLINNVYLVPTSDYQASIPTFFCPCCSTVCFRKCLPKHFLTTDLPTTTQKVGQTLPCCDSKICQGCYLAKYKFQSSSTINLSDSQLSLQNRDSTSTNKSSSASTITEKRVKKCPVCHVIQESSKNAGESWWSLRSSKSRVADGKSTASSCADVSDLSMGLRAQEVVWLPWKRGKCVGRGENAFWEV